MYCWGEGRGVDVMLQQQYILQSTPITTKCSHIAEDGATMHKMPPTDSDHHSK
jgi:hypothetical protein